MSPCGKLVSQIDMNTSAEKFYKLFKHKVHQMPNISPILQNVEVHEGDWDSHGHGSIKIWNYTIDGKAEVFKEQVFYDDKNMSTTLMGLEGDVFKIYKCFKGTYQVVPKGPEHCLAVLTLEYEKRDPCAPYPYKYLDLMTNVTKDIESYLK